MSDQSIETILKDEGLFGVVRSLLASPNEAVEIAKRFSQTVNDLYWKQHDVRAAVQLGACGISFAMSAASSSRNAGELLSHAKALAYNTASFAWPGWDEPWAALTSSDIALGADAAKLNARLAVELNKPAKAKAAANWMLGAYAMVSREWMCAIESFEQAAVFSEQATDRAGTLMNQGYVALTGLLEHPHDESAFGASLDALRAEGSDDAKAYVEQLLTARKVFTADRRI